MSQLDQDKLKIMKGAKLRTSPNNASFLKTMPFLTASTSTKSLKRLPSDATTDTPSTVITSNGKLSLQTKSTNASLTSIMGATSATLTVANDKTKRRFFGGSTTFRTKKREDKAETTIMDNYECPMCGKLVPENELVAYKERAYHLDCYRCSQCGEHLPRTDQPNLRKNQFLCDNCYGNKPLRPIPFLGNPTRLLPKSLTGKRGTKAASISRLGTKSGVRSLNRQKKAGVRTTTPSFNQTFSDNYADQDMDNFSMGTGIGEDESHGFDFAKIVKEIAYLKEHYTEQAMASVCSELFLQQMEMRNDLSEQKSFYRCICSGLRFRNSKVGAYAMKKEDYDRFKDFFHPLIRKVQGIPDNINLKVDSPGIKTRYQRSMRQNFQFMSPEMNITSCNFRYIRNLANYPMIGAMTISQRKKLEETLLPVFDALMMSEDYGGNVLRIDADGSQLKLEAMANVNVQWASDNHTTGKCKHVTIADFNEANIKLDRFAAYSSEYCKIDKFLHDTAISKFWPFGSGVYFSKDRKFRIFYNHEDHLEIVYADDECGSDLNFMYEQLRDFMKFFEQKYKENTDAREPPKYIVTKKLGFITSCPTHLGAAFAPSVTLELPNLVDDGELSRVAKECNFQYKLLDAKSVLSENSVAARMNATKRDSTVRICPIRKIFETEEMVLRNLYNLLPRVAKAEEEADYV